MRKYLVIDENKYGDTFSEVYDTLEEANEEAEYQWDHLTRREQKDRHIFVGHVEDTKEYLDDWAFEEDEVDYNCYHSVDTDEGYFNSENI